MPTSLSYELIAANLRYGAQAEPLRQRAYAHVVMKVLLGVDPAGALTVPEIRRRCRDVIANGTPTLAAVEDAVKLLARYGYVTSKHKSHALTPEFRERLEKQLQRRREVLDSAIRRYLPQDIPGESLRAWLDDTAIKFFSQYGERWVQDVTGRTKGKMKLVRLNEIVASTASAHGFADRVESLREGFRRLLLSEQEQDQNLVWHYGRSMFSARLLAADLSADPISATSLRGGVLLLDTNVLITFALGAGDSALALVTLARVLGKFNIRVGYLRRTLDEYDVVFRDREKRTLQLLHGVPFEVFKETDDDWIKAGVLQHCVNESEWKGFFGELQDPTDELHGGIRAAMVTDHDVELAAEHGAEDVELVRQIQAAWQEANPNSRPKGNVRAKHDAALDAAARYFRLSGPCVVATTDRSMRDLALKRSGLAETPMWVSVEALLQVFAVEQDGDGVEATDFAPLMSRIIASDLEQVDELAYSIDDLEYLADLEAECFDLPVEDVQSLARDIHRLRMTGAARTDTELRRTLVNRIYQKRRQLGRDVEETRAVAAEVRADNSSLQLRVARQSKAINALSDARIKDRTSAIKRRATLWFALQGVVAFGALAVVGLAAFLFYLFVIADGPSDRPTRFGVATALLPAVTGMVTRLVSLWPRYLQKLNHAEADAQAEVAELITAEMEPGI